MTVKHLRQLQRQQVTQAVAQDPTVVNKYKAGVNECANEVIRYLGSLQGVDETVRERLINHLGNVVTSVNSQTQENVQYSQPLNVQIPQHLNQAPVVPPSSLLIPANVPASPVVLHSNVPSLLHNSGHTQVPSTSPAQHGDRVNTRICGSFQIVPSSCATGAVALYLGQSQTVSQSSNSPSQAIPLYSSHIPPPTKASLKAFDDSAFSSLSYSQECSIRVSPVSEKYMPNQLDVQLHKIAVGCGRTPSPLKVEDVWRPW